MNPLDRYGWQTFCRSSSPSELTRSPDLIPARILREERDRYLLITPHGERSASLAGRFRHLSTDRLELPAPGDWVLVRAPETSGPATISATLPRGPSLVRRAAGGRDAQVLAANVDLALVVTAPDRDLNLRRLERYLCLCRGAGVDALVVLNKADLLPEGHLAAALRADLASLGPDLERYEVSAESGERVEDLRARACAPGRTVALIGSSGVGKSTLCNALLGLEGARCQDTGAIRASDGRGRHTTTRRDLLALPDGGVLIDTPGLRELGLWEVDALAEAFPDLKSYAAACRFRDCRHSGEPGCAVRDAVETGILAPERVDSHAKLRREQRRLERRRSRKPKELGRPRSARKARSARRREW